MTDFSGESCRAIFQQLGVALFVYRVEAGDGKTEFFLQDLNALAAEALGAPGEVVLARRQRLAELFVREDPERDDAEILRHSARALDGIPQYFDWPLKRSDGSNRRWQIQLRRLALGDRLFLMLTALPLEAPERRSSMPLLAANDACALAETLPLNIARWSPEGRYLYVNSVHARTLGKPSPEIVGGQIPETHDRVKAMIGEVASRGEAVLFVRQPVSDVLGNILLHEVSLLPEFDQRGKVHSVLGIGREIAGGSGSDAGRGTEPGAALSSDPRGAGLEKRTFLANVSHELRTPMNAILGMTYLMKKGDASPVQAEQLDKIGMAARHLLHIINDILDYSKIDAGKLVLDVLPMKLADVMSNVCSMMSERAAAKGLSLQVEAIDVPECLFGDPIRLQQALLNYAANAIKFTDRGCIVLRVRRVESRDDRVLMRFEVEDQGVGISAEHIPLLFRPFEQLDPSCARRQGGTGLGLAITRRLACLMGGDAGVDSVKGVGSCFWFSAVLSRAGEGIAPPVASSVLDVETRIRQRHGGRRLLVVDDDMLNREVARLLLAETGLQVDTVSNGDESLQRVGSNDYALILMDWQMPVMDGVEATGRIRALPRGRKVPIVAMTAHVDPDNLFRCRQAGMNDLLVKPFEPHQLFSCVLKWLDQAMAPGDLSGDCE